MDSTKKCQMNILFQFDFIQFQYYFTPTNQTEALKIINKLNISSSGYDEMDPKIEGKKKSFFIAIPVGHVISCSLATGVVPFKLKLAKVAQIFFNGQQDDSCNYRLVSILPSFSKNYHKPVILFCEKMNISLNLYLVEI